MKHAIDCALLAIAVCTTSLATAQPLITRSGEVGTLKVDLGYNIILNEKSSLKRHWVFIHDPNSPVDVEGPTNVGVQYEKDYWYVTNTGIKAKQPVTAVELIHVIVDMFGRKVITLQNVEVADLAAQEVRQVLGKWRVWNETDAKLAHTSFTYVRSARTADDKVYFAPMAQVLEVIRKGLPSLTSTDIEPKKSEK